VSTLIQVSAAGAEPVDLVTAKRWLRVDADQTEDDEDISASITAAREYAEMFCRRSFLSSEQWKLTLDQFPLGRPLPDGQWEFGYTLWETEGAYLFAKPEHYAIEIPMGPILNIVSLTYIDTTGTTQTLDPSLYFILQEDDGNPRIYPKYGSVWPAVQPQAGAITITFNAGTVDVPATVKLAMKQLMAHWWRNREGVVMVSGVVPQDVKLTVKDLLWLHRNVEL
jgi:uncharacterized phiE125 gp8 family phage protein